MDQMAVVICVRSGSPRCWRARRLLGRRGYAFEVVELSSDGELPPRLAAMVGSKAARRLPQVLVDGRLVGGYEVVRALDRSGVLDRLVRGEV
jgi:glutaredoxin